MVEFEEATLVKGAYVVINGVEYPVHMPQYSGGTQLSPENMNKLQKDLETHIITDQEIETHEYIDGKKVFLKRITFGALPNASSKSVSTGLIVSQVTICKPLTGLAYGLVNNESFVLTLPDIAPNYAEGATRLSLRNINSYYNIIINTGVDRSNFNAFIDIYYTKK